MLLLPYHAQMISSLNLQREIDYSVVFWYLDEDILNKYYSGAIHCLNELRLYPGVKQADILPIEGFHHCDIKYDDDLQNVLQGCK
jgi:hypothetical protein